MYMRTLKAATSHAAQTFRDVHVMDTHKTTPTWVRQVVRGPLQGVVGVEQEIFGFIATVKVLPAQPQNGRFRQWQGEYTHPRLKECHTMLWTS